MNPEEIAKTTYTQVEKYLTKVLGENRMAAILKEFRSLFPSWSHLWDHIRWWLEEHPMTNMQRDIHSFARIFPNYPSFARELDDALAVHDSFWNEVHTNLCVAKGRLIC